MVISDI